MSSWACAACRSLTNVLAEQLWVGQLADRHMAWVCGGSSNLFSSWQSFQPVARKRSACLLQMQVPLSVRACRLDHAAALRLPAISVACGEPTIASSLPAASA